MDSNVMEVQHQVRENSVELQKYLVELESWEKEMKKKDEEFKLLQTTPEKELPPVRNVLYRPKKKSRHKKQKVVNGDDKAELMGNGEHFNAKEDAFMANKCYDDEKLKEVSQSDETGGNSSDQEEELEILRKKQSAILHKEKGNDFFKKGNYDSAINSYTSGIILDPENPLLLANRAMAFLKKEQFQAAENDCDLSLSFDPTYVKAYLRRGSARKSLNKLSSAKEDFANALELEPENKQAQSELKHIDKILASRVSSESKDAEKGNKKLHDGKPLKKTKGFLEVTETPSTLCIENECIFPDSVPILPRRSSGLDAHLDPETEIEVKEMDEKQFVKTVQERMKSHLDDPVPSNLSLQMETVNLNLKIPLPPVPETSFQFIADWNEISDDLEMRYKYLKQLPPEKFPVVFKHYMEPTVFPTLLETLASSFIENGDDVFDYMKYLPSINRFRTTLMMLSDKEEKDLEILLMCVKSSNRPQSEIAEVLRKYRS